MRKPLTDGERLIDASIVAGTWDFSKKPEGHAQNTLEARVAVIGDIDVVSVFGALGFDVFPYTREYKIRETIKDLAARDYTLILITETCARGLDDFLATYTAMPYPIILPIPDGASIKGLGMERINTNIKKVNAAKENS